MAEFKSELSANVHAPLYHRLRTTILEEVQSGHWAPNEMIPTEYAFMDHFELSRTTVRQALNDLVKDGVLYRRQGVGTFVASPKIEMQILNQVISVFAQMQSMGMSPSIQVHEQGLVTPSSEIRSQLNVPARSKVVRIHRTFVVDAEPIVTVMSYLPRDLAEFVLAADLTNTSLYKLLATHEDTQVTHVSRLLEARLAGESQASLLRIEPGFPIQHVITRASNLDNRVVEYNISDFRGDRCSFALDMGEFTFSMSSPE